jgi:hypothetical protein
MLECRVGVRIELIKNKIQKLKNRRYPPSATIATLETQLLSLMHNLGPYRPFRDILPKHIKFRSVTTIASIPHSAQVAQSMFSRIGKTWTCPCGKVLRWTGPSAAAKHQLTTSCKSKRLAK